jgi:hypothetical protein
VVPSDAVAAAPPAALPRPTPRRRWRAQGAAPGPAQWLLLAPAQILLVGLILLPAIYVG